MEDPSGIGFKEERLHSALKKSNISPRRHVIAAAIFTSPHLLGRAQPNLCPLNAHPGSVCFGAQRLFMLWVSSSTGRGTTCGCHLGHESSREGMVSCGMGMWCQADEQQRSYLGQHGGKDAYPVGIRGHRILSPIKCPQSGMTAALLHNPIKQAL